MHKRTSRLREISERFFAGRAGNGEIPGFANRGSGLGIRTFVFEFFGVVRADTMQVGRRMVPAAGVGWDGSLTIEERNGIK